MLIFVLFDDNDKIHRDVQAILADYSNQFYVSAEVVRELIHLFKTKNIGDLYNKRTSDILVSIEEANIEIKPLTKHQLKTYIAMETAKGHNDPIDHIIIAQAISDKIPLISSDNQFKHYTSQGLQFVFNKR
jgi:PIN domain nuclease of toxin-antitoxin system